MEGKPYLWIVFMRFPAVLEDEFNKWYDEVHVPLVSEEGHFLSISRYRITDAVESDLTKYVAVVEFPDDATFRNWLKSDCRAEAAADTAKTWEGKDMVFWPKAFYEPYKTYDI
ncbi:DUF4286 family protein [Chloroflexota bacterium]